MEFKKKFARDIYHARNRQKITQQAVSDDLSISLREYQNIEYGKVLPRLDTFFKLVDLFQLNLEVYRELLSVE